MSEAATSLKALQRSVPSERDDTEAPTQPRLRSRSCSRSPIAGSGAVGQVEPTDLRATDAAVQTSLSKDDMSAMQHDNRAQLVEATSASDTCGVHTRELNQMV